MLTPEDVHAEVALLRAMRPIGDHEAMHAEEDNLHQYVLGAIASDQCADPALCARIALSTLQVRFERWAG